MTQKTTMMWLPNQSQTSWSLKSSGPLGSFTMNKASGGDIVPVELFKILKDDAVKMLYSIRQQIWKTQQWPQDWKRSVFISISVQFSSVAHTAAHQVSLSITNSWSLRKLMSFESVMPSNHLILCHMLLLLPSSFPASHSFQMSQFFTSGGQNIGVSASKSVLPMNIQD